MSSRILHYLTSPDCFVYCQVCRKTGFRLTGVCQSWEIWLIVAGTLAKNSRLAEAFVEYFDARHADLRLLDLEHRLGLVSEDALLRTYRGVAYMDAATALGQSGRLHFPPAAATRFMTPEAFVAAESSIRRTLFVCPGCGIIQPPPAKRRLAF